MDNFNIEDFLMHCDEYQIAEESRFGSRQNISGELRLIYGHMLKYKYKPDNQSSSWIGTIITEFKKVSKVKPSQLNKVIDNYDIMNQAYKDSIKTVVCNNTGYKSSDFPKDRPYNWTIENIANFNFMMTFLYENAKDDDIKDYISNKINQRF